MVNNYFMAKEDIQCSSVNDKNAQSKLLGTSIIFIPFNMHTTIKKGKVVQILEITINEDAHPEVHFFLDNQRILGISKTSIKALDTTDNTSYSIETYSKFDELFEEVPEHVAKVLYGV